MAAYNYVLHTFRPTETIEAVMRLKGRHSLSQAQLKHLMVAFNELNGVVTPRAGMTFKIPLPFETVDDFGNVIYLPEPAVVEPTPELEPEPEDPART